MLTDHLTRNLEKIRFSITRLKLDNQGNPAYILQLLEKIRFSITRLKQEPIEMSYPDLITWKDKILDYEIETLTLHLMATALQPWKDKILDYEIETLQTLRSTVMARLLEKIRFSITRLKPPVSR